MVLEEVIRKLIEGTKENKYKWKSIDRYEVLNKPLSAYLNQHINYNVTEGMKIEKYRSYFEKLQLKVAGSLYTEYRDGYIYLFYYYKPRKYDSIRRYLSEPNFRLNNIVLIIGLQHDVNSEIKELNTIEYLPAELLSLYNLATEQTIKLDELESTYLSDL
ncbi:MAG: hypothetical protein OEZ22_13960 [Spirochaetia bacterium]|nr:hypothetical protein [Spirochaetia bacterium]